MNTWKSNLGVYKDSAAKNDPDMPSIQPTSGSLRYAASFSVRLAVRMLDRILSRNKASRYA